MSYEESLIALVDQRIRLNQQQTRALGTCLDRDEVGPGCSVLFDGSTVAVPVKVLGHVMLVPGQRCALERFGTEWLVVGAFDSPALGFGTLFDFAGSVSTSSASFVDHAGLDTFTFTKLRDSTPLKIYFAAMAFTNTAASGVRFGLRFTQTEGKTPYTPVDYDGPRIYFSQASHLCGVAMYTVQTSFPAGTYTGRVRWRMTEGTGSINTNNIDLYAINVEEYVNPVSRAI